MVRRIYMYTSAGPVRAKRVAICGIRGVRHLQRWRIPVHVFLLGSCLVVISIFCFCDKNSENSRLRQRLYVVTATDIELRRRVQSSYVRRYHIKMILHCLHVWLYSLMKYTRM